jgi:hypothetical protein
MMEVQEISCSNGTRRFIEAYVKYHHPSYKSVHLAKW